MQIQQSQESPITSSARTAYHTLRSAYRKVRATGNYLLNLIDQPVIILLYHRVADLPNDPEMLAVSPDNFRLHLQFLKEHCSIVRFEEEWLDEIKPAVAITFDDGYADNVLQALPILEEVGIPATFFVSTGNIGTGRNFWWDLLAEILLRENEFPQHFKLHDNSFGRVWSTETREQRRTLYDELMMLMHKVSSDRIDEWLDQLRAWAEPSDMKPNQHRAMNREELSRLAVSPWATLGAHTVSHAALAALSEEQQRKEIFTSKQDLEAMSGKKITTFSYPFGRRVDYNHISVRLCREAGFLKAASNFPGQVHRWSDSFQLPRHLVRNWDVDNFAVKVKSFWTR